ncbi:MAG: YajQ family cyclic di-GMP-binding protein [Chloroflexota bacterium]
MPSFDVVSRTDSAELDNAVNGVQRECQTRFDLKGTMCAIEREGDSLTITADDEMLLRQMQDLLKGYCARRSVDVRALDFKTAEPAAKGSLRQKVGIRQGIESDVAKNIVKSIKGTKMKVQVAVQGQELRVSGKKRDDLQEAIAHIKGMELDLPLQYINFRD